MRIYKLLPLFLFLGLADVWACPMQFLTAHAAPESMVAAIASGQTIRQCQQAEAWLLCIEGQASPGVVGNAASRQALLKAWEIKTRNSMSSFLAEKVKAKNLQDARTVGQTLAKRQAKIKGLEFLSFCENNWCGAIAAIRSEEAAKDLPPVYENAAFIRDYCKSRLEATKLLLQNGQGLEALTALKELHVLDDRNPAIDILAAQAFLLANRDTDALKIAENLYNSAKPMNVNQLEELGDLFLNLGHDKEALDLFTRASNLLTSSDDAI